MNVGGLLEYIDGLRNSLIEHNDMIKAKQVVRSAKGAYTYMDCGTIDFPFDDESKRYLWAKCSQYYKES